MDILYVGFLLGHGGDAVQMLELASGMAARGARVRIVVPQLETTKGLAQECWERGLPVVRTPWIQSSIDGVGQKPLDMVRLFYTYDEPIVHIHTGDCALPRTAMLARRLLRRPRAFVTVQSPYETIQPGEARAVAWANTATRQLQLVACPSEHSRRYQIRLGVPEDRVAVVRNSVDVPRFAGGNAKVAQDALQLPEDAQLVLFSSRLDAQKRPVDAVKAFARVAPDLPRAHMALLGTGKLEGAVRSAVKELGLEARVHFPGHQGNVQDWLAASTVWVLPTERENFSLAVLEAMAAGCAILSTNCPGNDEVLVDGTNALTTAVGDVDGMTGGLQRLLSDARLRTHLAANARAAAQAYSAERMVDAYAMCYERH
jgi:glycosyltransferase involved in cell wall biosynthesis